MTQKQKQPIGRPKIPATEARSIFISTRISAEEDKEIKAAIKRSAKSKSDWMREALMVATRNDNPGTEKLS